MTKKSGHSGRLSFSLPKLLLTIVALSVVSELVSVLPAAAEELKEWQYDVQTRSLTLVLPSAVTPSVSVTTPSQLLLELPDMHVGSSIGQTVQDGVVESIVVEQATPETVEVVIEFVAGTVLSNAQTAVPLAGAQSGEQQWQIRPALAATSQASQGDNQTDNQVSSQPSEADPAIGGASSLQIPVPEIAQATDSLDLPVLEPSVPLNEPVNVPPLNTAIPAAVDSTPTLAEPDPIAANADSQSADGQSADGQSADGQENTSLASRNSDLLTLDSPSISMTDTDSDEPALVEAVAEPFAEEAIRPSNTNRWPEPIPFGQPLPR